MRRERILSPKWVKDIQDDLDRENGVVPLQVGKVYRYQGKTVKVTDGEYYGTYGLSNFWYWREVLPDGSLGKEQSGYDHGGFEPVAHPTVTQ